MPYEIRAIPAEVGYTSSVGILNTDYPLRHGNYFGFGDPPAHCVNMWAENLQEAVRRGMLPDNLLQVRIYRSRLDQPGEWAVVTDSRLPAGWCTEGPCLTGTSMPAGLLVEMFGDMGWDPTPYLCGCESNRDSPQISISHTPGCHPIYRCGRCNRSWTDPLLDDRNTTAPRPREPTPDPPSRLDLLRGTNDDG